MLHLRCGQDILSQLADAGLPGDFASWDDPLCEGPLRDWPDDGARRAERSAWLGALGTSPIDLLVLAGYLKLVPPAVVRAYAGRIINIHPALLPRHGGAGMYGRRVHEAVLASGDQESGATVHLVDEEYDQGAVLAQARVPVRPGDTPATLAERVLGVEHRLLPAAVRRAAEAGRPVSFTLNAENLP